jgi:LmbE family N-acetylglucosaminyl deacetylase
MKLHAPNAEIFIPDDSDETRALDRTTHLGIGAHADDLELMAIEGILACIRSSERWFTGIVVTDGAGSPQGARALDRRELVELRRAEQREAAKLGGYSAMIQLGFSSEALKRRDAADGEFPTQDLQTIIAGARPEVVYTHGIADKHDTHVAVALRVLEACRGLPSEQRPKRVIGCEVWRDQDWLVDADKVLMPVEGDEDLQAALISVFKSQIDESKRYDLAALGRRRAHATFFESHAGDRYRGLTFGMDLTPLLDGGDVRERAEQLIRRFESEVIARLERLGA